MHELGMGVKQDLVEMLKWHHKAAAQNDPLSQFNIGKAYEEGLGVRQNAAEAMKWYRLAANQGDARARSRLAALQKQADDNR